jgi:hypothetical protein
MPTRLKRWLNRRESVGESLVRFRDRDAAENVDSRLRDNERFEVAAVWVAEVFTPSHIANLQQGIESLGWSISPDAGLRDVDSWLERAAKGAAGGSIDLGPINPLGKHQVTVHRYADLDKEVANLAASLHALEGGLVALLVSFNLMPDATAPVANALSADYTTFHTRGPSNYRRGLKDALDFLSKRGRVRQAHITRQRGITSFSTPNNQRAYQGRKALIGVNAACVSWLTRHFSGTFAAGLLDGRYPTCQLLIFEEREPFAKRDHDSALALVDLDDDMDVLGVEGIALRAKLPESWAHRKDAAMSMFNVTFAVRRDDAVPAEGHHFANDRMSSQYISYCMGHHIQPLLIRWVYHALISGGTQRLGESRNATARDYGRSRRVVRTLGRLKQFVASDAADMLTVARAAQAFASSKRRFLDQVDTWKWTADFMANKDPYFVYFRKALRQRAVRLENGVQAHLAITSTIATLASSKSQVRVARYALVAGAVSLIVAVASLVVAYVALKK